jgi:radical SAM superfamily enzyme YgiQ (UPF0313 family)
MNNSEQHPEQGPLRPPSEARSLLIRVVRNCPWNRCSFCPGYKGEKFSLRKTEDVTAEIEQLASDAGQSRVSTVFLQDGDSLIVPVESLLTILEMIRKRLPSVTRITAYARSRTILQRPVEVLRQLREAGLSRIHIGIESGCDEVLEFVNKGATAAMHLEACKRVIGSGIEVCCYVMPGLGGRRWSEKHALDTGRLIAAISPQHVRLRTCFVLEGTPLAQAYLDGKFEPLNDEEVVREIRLFLGQLKDTRTEFISDHRMNLLLELNGDLPQDYDRLIGIIDSFLGLSDEMKKLFITGRRLNIIRRLAELESDDIINRIKADVHLYKPAIPTPKNILY